MSELEEQVTESGLHVVQVGHSGVPRVGAHTRVREAVERELDQGLYDEGVCVQCGDHVWKTSGLRHGWLWRYRGERVCSVRCLARRSVGRPELV